MRRSRHLEPEAGKVTCKGRQAVRPASLCEPGGSSAPPGPPLGHAPVRKTAVFRTGENAGGRRPPHPPGVHAQRKTDGLKTARPVACQKPREIAQRLTDLFHDLRPRCEPMRSRRRRLSSVRICSARITLSFCSPCSPASDGHMGGQARLVHLPGYGQHDHRGAVSIAHVVLYHQHGANAALFRAHHGIQTGAVQIAPVIMGSRSA